MTQGARSGTLAKISKKAHKMATRLDGTAASAKALQRVSYTHDGMIDLIIAQPMLSTIEIAKHFGYTPQWVRQIINSDAFLERLAARKTEVVDPTLTASLEEKLRTLASASMEVLVQKLDTTKDSKIALASLELSTKALGFGARQSNVNVQNSFVVAMPGKASSETAWAEAYGNGGKGFSKPAIDLVTDVPPPSLKLTDLIEPGVPS